MQLQDDSLLHFALVVGLSVFMVGFTQEGQCGPIATRSRFDHMRQKSLASLIVVIAQVLTTAVMLRLAVRTSLYNKLAVLLAKLSFRMRSQVEVAAMRHTFQLSVGTRF